MRTHFVKFRIKQKFSESIMSQMIVVDRGESVLEATRKFMRKRHKSFGITKDHEIEIISENIV